MRHRWLILTLLFVVAGLWCVAMGVLGLWLICGSHAGLLSSGAVSISAGLVCLSASQLVFVECVAQRLFPSPHTPIPVMIRGVNTLTLGGSVCVLLTALLIVSV